MPVICTREQSLCHRPITTRVLAKKQVQKDTSTEILRTFSVKISNSSKQSRYLEGTTLPNSTVKQISEEHNVEEKYIATTSNTASTIVSTTNATTSNAATNEETIKDSTTKINQEKQMVQDSPNKHETENYRDKNKAEKEPPIRNSIVSGSPKLQELKELHTQLRKTVYKAPQPVFEPRRPTIEAIKAAIEKAKRMTNHKNMGTDDENPQHGMSTSDVSTSTDKRKKKSSKKVDNQLASTSTLSPQKKAAKEKKPIKRKKPKKSLDVKLKLTTNIKKE